MQNKFVLAAASVFVLAPAQAAFFIDFRNGVWDHSAIGGPSSSNGWAVNPSTNRGYASGTAEIDTGVFLTVSSTFIGTAQPGTSNFKLDPVNTPGFAFQNRGTGDRNTTIDPVTGRILLENYQKITFTFSAPVIMDFLQLADIDTATSSGSQTWRDAVGVEYWNGSAPTDPGSGINAEITHLGSRLVSAQSARGLNYAWANTLGNTTTSNPASATDASSVTFSSSGEAIDGFSVYFWNRGTAANGGQHGIVLQAQGNRLQLAPVPEPTSLALVALSTLAGLTRRKR